MVGGVLRCLGSSQHLREKYGLGFQLEFNLNIPGPEAIRLRTEQLGGCVTIQADIGSDQITETQTRESFVALNLAHLLNRINIDESGAYIFSCFSLTGMVKLSHLASWVELECYFDKLIGFLKVSFPDYQLRERQGAKVCIDVPFATSGGTKRRLADMFGTVEGSKDSISVREYSVSQTSLEQIFNRFAQCEDDASTAGGYVPRREPLDSISFLRTAEEVNY
jgi:ATP-binding cassette subfamily A (ABC1) protein 3